MDYFERGNIRAQEMLRSIETICSEASKVIDRFKLKCKSRQEELEQKELLLHPEIIEDNADQHPNRVQSPFVPYQIGLWNNIEQAGGTIQCSLSSPICFFHHPDLEIGSVVSRTVILLFRFVKKSGRSQKIACRWR